MPSTQRESIVSSTLRLRPGRLALLLTVAAWVSAAAAQDAPVVTISEVTPGLDCGAGSTCPHVRVKWSVQATPQIILQSHDVQLELTLSNGSKQNLGPQTVGGSAREALLVLPGQPSDTVKTFRAKIVTTFARPRTKSVEKAGALPPVLVPPPQGDAVLGGLGETSPGPSRAGQTSTARPRDPQARPRRPPTQRSGRS